MVKNQHKIISLMLCLVLVVTAVFVGTTGVFAASGDTVYVKVNNGWSNLHCYMWNNDSDKNAEWPGVTMTQVESDVYSYTLPKDYANIIFNNGSGGNGNQTSDMSYQGGGKIYDLKSGTWSNYSGAVTPTQGNTTATQAPTVKPTTPVGGVMTVYLENEAGWSSPNCYMWNSENDKNASWPGVAMTKLGGNVYQYTASKSYVNCIFNNGSGSPQTSDLTAKNGYIYNNSTNSWSVYDTNDLQVESFEADPAGSAYIGSEVTLSAKAANTKSNATVFYKFSVTGAGGTSVVSDFSSANTVTWTPVSAGTYTITFDFKDSAGNTNNRTMSYTVSDDSTLVKPVIKGVSPANLNLIKTGSATTVTVNAGGGKTGTNLLFYKYIVTDPNGVKNTPYYTLNSTYTFTPAIHGKYTVDVYVQGSDNSTVNKVYTYTATGQDIPATTAPITAPVQTTTAKPTTQPTTAKPTTQPTTARPTVQPTTAKPTNPAKLLGDVDGDGRVTILDATYIQKSIVELPDVIQLPYLDLEVCDVDHDGVVSIKDATAIQLIIVQG